MRIVFAGTPEAAVPSLRVLHASGHEIVLVVTRPDAPVGRKRVVTPSPVAAVAAELGLPILKTARLDRDATDRIVAVDAEIGVIVAYGALVREPLLSAPPHGWINLHFSLLPRWRGAAPVQRALMAGDRVTGAVVFQLVPQLDAGDVYDRREYRIGGDATAGEVLVDLSGLGAELLRDVVAQIEAGQARPEPQQGQETLAPKLSLADGQVRWEEPAEQILARVRGVTPEPGASTTVDGAVFKLLAVRAADADVQLAPGEIAMSGGALLVGTGTAAILIERVQPAGKGAMAANDWWRGVRGGDTRLGS